MKDEDIHVGDVVRIRSFEDMKSEFGVDQHGHIHGDYNAWFGDGMKALCGSVFTVTEYRNGEYRSVEGIEDCDDGSNWSITAWMLEPFNDTDELEPASDDDFDVLFS